MTEDHMADAVSQNIEKMKLRQIDDNLRALLEARTYYQKLLDRLPSWNINAFEATPISRQKGSR